jgi:hypothetical protein
MAIKEKSPDCSVNGHAESNGKAGDDKQRTPRPTQALPTNRIATPKQFELLRAFGAVSGPDGRPVTNAEVSKVASLHAATVGLATPFFCAIGLLQKTSDGLVPAPEVRDFTAAHEWNAETAFHRTACIFRKTWFFERLLPKLRFQPMSRDAALQELAMAANAAPAYRGQLETLLEYLEASGVVSIDGDTIRLAPESELNVDESDGRSRRSGTARESAVEPLQSRDAIPRAPVATTFSGPTAGVVQFNISVKVDMTEFAGWSPERISAFFSGVAQVLAAKGTIEEKASSFEMK